MPIASPYAERPCSALEIHTRSQINRSSGSSAAGLGLCEEEANLPADGGRVPLRPDVFNVIRLEGNHETGVVRAYVNGELLADGAIGEIVYEWSGFYFGETTGLGSGTSIISDFCFSIDSLACSIDADGDGVGDNADAFPDDNAASVDTDRDGMPDDWNNNATSEQIAASDLVLDEDDDNDGLEDNAELALGTDPLKADTDGDGLTDSEELSSGLNALLADTDGDNVSDGDDGNPLDANLSLPKWAQTALTFDSPEGGIVVDAAPEGLFSSSGTHLPLGGLPRYVYPADAEDGAFVRNTSFEQYPISFEHGGTVFFYGIPSSDYAPEVSDQPIDLVFRFENTASTGTDATYTTNVVTITERSFYSVDLPALPNANFNSVSIILMTRDIEVIIPWVRLTQWQAKTTEELIDPDGEAITLLTDEANAGSAFSNGLCGYESKRGGWDPYCGSQPEDALVKWNVVDVNEGRVQKAISLDLPFWEDAAFYISSGKPLDLSPYRDTAILSFDLRVTEVYEEETYSEFYPSVYCTWRCGAFEIINMRDLAVNEWTRFEISLADLEAKGLDLSKIETGLELSGFFYFRPIPIQLANIKFLLQGPDDADGDGVGDFADAFPNDPAASVDTDRDGAPDTWNDGASESQIAASSLSVDSFIRDPAASVDTDSDGMPDDWNSDATSEQIAASTLMLDDDDDNDGTPDASDSFPNEPAAATDSDGDGYPDEFLPSATQEQIDASGLLIDAFPYDPAVSIDSDRDGYPDDWNENATEEQIANSGFILDIDDDNDGLEDSRELEFGTDPLNPDTDADGTVDGYDALPLDSNEIGDFDGDGIGDIADDDDDNDGILDSDDLFPRSDYQHSLIDADLTANTLPNGIVEFPRAVSINPPIRFNSKGLGLKLRSDNSVGAVDLRATHCHQTSLGPLA